MSRITLSQAAALLGEYVAPQDSFTSRINLAAHRLHQQGKWKGLRFTLFIKAFDGQITTPAFVESLDKLIRVNPRPRPHQYDGDNEDNEIVTIQSPWFQFSDSPHPFRNPSSSTAIRLDDGYVTFRDPHPAAPFQIQLDTTETGILIVKALDASGHQIWSGSQEGFEIDIAATPTYISPTPISQIYQIVKPSTAGRLRIFNINTGDLLAEYGPQEQSPNYQRYRVANCDCAPPDHCCGHLYYANATRAFVPALLPDDNIFPSNINALRYALQAIRFEDIQDEARANIAWQNAFKVLDEELEVYESDATPSTLQVEKNGFLKPIRNLL